MDEHLEEHHLIEIEDTLTRHPGEPANDDLIRLLIAEVRRLKKAVNGAYEGGYENGESSAEADITGIILDPIAGDNATAEQILRELKDHLGLEEDLPVALQGAD